MATPMPGWQVLVVDALLKSGCGVGWDLVVGWMSRVPEVTTKFRSVPKMEGFLNLIYGYLGVGFPIYKA